MSRPRKTPKAPILGPSSNLRGADLRSLTDEDENTPRPPSWSDLEGSDAGLVAERSFFAEGLSDDAIAAACERQREHEALQRAASGRTNRWLIAAAAVGACAILAFGLAPRHHRPAGAVATAPPAAAAVIPVIPAAAIASPGRTVGLQDLRKGGPAPAEEPKEEPKTACDQLLARGTFTEMQTACARAFDMAPDAALAVKVARNALERQRYADARTWAQKAIQIDRQRSEAFLTLGGAEQGLGHGPLARIAYAHYLELEPQGAYADDIRALIDQL